MPVLEHVTTRESRSVWRAPDGQREIFELLLEYQGQRFAAKSYSKDISVIGWTGSVETYEKPGKMGAPTQTFVKQPPKEDGSYGPAAQHSSTKLSADPFTMYLSYAKDITVALLAVSGVAAKSDYTDLIDQTITGAYALYEGRPEARAKHQEVMERRIDELKGDDPVYEPSVRELNDILGRGEQ